MIGLVIAGMIARTCRVVDAQDGDAIERQPLREIDERALQPLEVVPVCLHVIGVDVGDHREHGGQIQERRIGFVGFGDQEIALAEARVRAGRKQPAADDERRVEPAFGEHRGDQLVVVVLPCVPAIAMPCFKPHQLGEHQRARHDRNPAFARGGDFRVVRRDGGRHDDDVGIGDIGRRVADRDRHAEPRETRA